MVRVTLVQLHYSRWLPIKLIESLYVRYKALCVSDKIKHPLWLSLLTLNYTLSVKTHLVGFKEPTREGFNYIMAQTFQWQVIDQTTVMVM